ncbi:MAG TPA: outer membrane beta-barrel protein [Terracidiphilus sp.]|nr:outer membrane beta-barrel protein [Terracidiphilus sp.]
MQTNWKQAAFLLIGFVVLTAAAQAQTDISASAFGTFNNSTSGNGTDQSAANSGGGMVGVRHIFNPLLGVEFNFAVNGAAQSLSTDPNSCALRCNNQPLHVSATGLEFTANYVVSKKIGNLTPFAEAGLGFVFTNTTGPTIGLNSLSRPVWVGGGGTDWNFAPRLGLRLQYRVNTYKAPDVYRGYSPTGGYVFSQEPMVGAFFRF